MANTDFPTSAQRIGVFVESKHAPQPINPTGWHALIDAKKAREFARRVLARFAITPPQRGDGVTISPAHDETKSNGE